MTADEHTASFRKRKGEAFEEAGMWWVIDADGHQWGHTDEGWVRFTDEDDAFVQEVARGKKRRAR